MTKKKNIPHGGEIKPDRVIKMGKTIQTRSGISNAGKSLGNSQKDANPKTSKKPKPS